MDARFLAEAKILGQLEHPNIVPLYDLMADDPEQTFFTMRYIQGKTLKEIISLMAGGSQHTLDNFSWARRAQVLQQICDAIEYAHSRGVIHCDLKPANIMIGAFGELVVMDWGVATLSDAKMDVDLDTESLYGIDLNDDSTIIGTPAYISPETFTGDSPNPSRDVFAIGVIMYELLALEHPFRLDSVEETIKSVRKHKPKPLYDIRKSGQRTIPVELHHICMKALNKDPEKRYESCAELHHDLQLYLDGRFPMKCPSTALKRMSQSANHYCHGNVYVWMIVGNFLQTAYGMTRKPDLL